MPNWCNNDARIEGSKEQIDAIVSGLSTDGKPLFETIRPLGDWDYMNSVNNWGTKWDAEVIDWERVDETTIRICFDTAWSPPIQLYEFMMEQGYSVEASYHEPGMGFAGRWSDGDDDYYDYSDCENADAIAEFLPEELDEMYCISEDRRNWDEENED